MSIRPRSRACFLLIALLAASWVHASGQTWDVEAAHGPSREVAFTVTEGTWMSVTVSPDGRTLVFDLLGDIYSVPADGGTATATHDGPAMQIMPRFSPDGERIMYLSDADGGDNVWTSRPDGTDARRLTDAAVDLVTTPAWGPDGYAVAAKTYARAEKTGSSELRLYHPRGGDGRLLVETPANGSNVFEPEVSNDGAWLYYTEQVSEPHPSHVFIDPNQMNFAVMARNLNDGSTHRVAGGFGGATTPQVSPDGRQLAFVRRVKDKTVLFVHDLESGRERPVFNGLDRDAQASFIPQGTYYPRFDWFPDNRHIAIWAQGRIQRIDTRSGSAQVIPISAPVRQRITEAVALDHGLPGDRVRVGAVQQFALAPIGDAAAFSALGRVWVQDQPDATPRRLTGSTAQEHDLAYAPDGETVAFAAWEDEGGGTLMVAKPSGSGTRALVRSPGIVRQPAWSPDGGTLSYVIAPGSKCAGGYDAEPGIYLVAAAGGEPRRLADSGSHPRFGPAGERVYFQAEGAAGIEIRSVDLHGGNPRTHVIAGSADVTDLRLSPDLRWLAFRDGQRLYVTAYRETGAPVRAAADMPGNTVREVSRANSHDLVWSADSRSVSWLVGPTLQTAAVDSVARQNRHIELTVAADEPQGTVAFTGARLITMRGAEVIDNGTLVVAGNRIVAAGPADSTAVPAAATVIDAAGKTIMPGLVDMHGHLDDCYYANSGFAPQKLPSHYAALAFGITSNFDPYTSDLPGFAISEARQAGYSRGPRLIHTGRPLHGRAGRPDGSYAAIDSYADAARAVALKDALGARILKSYKQPLRSQRQQIVEAARAHGLLTSAEGEAHFYFNLSMILDGYSILEHNLPVATYYDDVVQLMARGGTAHTPTLTIVFGAQLGENYLYQTTRSWEDPRIRTFVPETTSSYSAIPTPHSAPPHVRGMITAHVADELWDIGFRSVARSMKVLDDAGVTVNAGSHGQIQGVGLHWEMWLLAEGGMSHHRVLRTATVNGARTLGIDGDLGTLAPGMLADLIVLDANPLDDIRNSRSVRYSMVNGRLYDAMSVDEIGNYDRPRGPFYWEQSASGNSEWRSSWSEQ